jgi:GH24 family phage-related lysozyme (muramidase)
MKRAEAEEVLLILFHEEYGKAVNDFLRRPSPQHAFDGIASPLLNLGAGALKWECAATAKAGNYKLVAELLEGTGTTAAGKNLAALSIRVPTKPF